MKRSLLTTICLAITSVVLIAQPNGTGTYYEKAHGKKGRELKTAMYEIINTPSVMDYDALWTAYRTSDAIFPFQKQILHLSLSTFRFFRTFAT